MKILKLKRTFIEGSKNFVRNKWLSLATIILLSLSLYVVGVTSLLVVAGNIGLENIKKSIDISVFFNPDVSPEKIQETKKEIEKNDKVLEVKYISKEDALNDFMHTFKSDPVISQALDEIGENPLLDSLVIKAKDTADYESISEFLEKSSFRENFDSINYGKNKETIDKLDRIIKLIEKTGLVAGIIFLTIAILITFNTIRLNMYARQHEFEIMRLVGASNLYVELPSVFEGIFYGIAGAIVAIGLSLATIESISPLTQGIVSGGNLLKFYFNYFWIIAGGILSLGIILGMVSSFIAIRRYLKI